MTIKSSLGNEAEDRTPLLSYFKGAGCKAPLELYTHLGKLTTGLFDFRRV
ncbi:TPA: hypothetical protein ACGPA6_001677 [Streptococcus suis]